MSTANEALRRFSSQIIALDIRDPREGLRRRAAPMLGFALAGFGSGQKSVSRAGETRHEARHLRLHRRARRDAAEDLRGSARLAAGGRGRRLLRLSPHRASRDAVVDDAVAQRVFGRRRARNAAHPPRHAAISVAALPSAAVVGRALHARSPQRRPPRHRRGARHLAHGVRRLRRRFRAGGRRLRARVERALPRLYAGAHRLPLRPLHLQGRPGRDPAAAAPASAVVVRAARRSRSGVCRTVRHARGDARPGREGREYACDLPRALADLRSRPQAPAIAGGDAPLRRDARDLRCRFRRRGRAPRAAGL